MFSVRIDRTRKIPVTILIRAMGVISNGDILEMFGEDPRFTATFEKDPTSTRDEALLEIYKRLRPGEPLNVESAESLIMNMFFDPKRYDLARVGRYKFDKKLGIATRIKGKTVADDIVSPLTGEILAHAGDALNQEMADAIEHAGVNKLDLLVNEKRVRVFSNDMVFLSDYMDMDLSDMHIKKVRRAVLEEILDQAENDEEAKKAVYDRLDELSPKHITIDDILASINYVLNLANGVGGIDDIDHLGNRRLRCVGELLQNQFRIGLARMERVVRERMTIQAYGDHYPPDFD